MKKLMLVVLAICAIPCSQIKAVNPNTNIAIERPGVTVAQPQIVVPLQQQQAWQIFIQQQQQVLNNLIIQQEHAGNQRRLQQREHERRVSHLKKMGTVAAGALALHYTNEVASGDNSILTYAMVISSTYLCCGLYMWCTQR